MASKYHERFSCGWIAFPYRLNYKLTLRRVKVSCGWIAFPYRLNFYRFDLSADIVAVGSRFPIG